MDATFAQSVARMGTQTNVLGQSRIWHDTDQSLSWVAIRRLALRCLLPHGIVDRRFNDGRIDILLLARLHVLAGIDGGELREFDSHANVDRESVIGTLPPLKDDCVPVPQGFGQGATSDVGAPRRDLAWALG
jgi:hypothetical protein